MSKEEMTEVLEAIEEVAKQIGRYDPPMQPNYLVLSLGNQIDTLRRLISEQEQSSIPKDPMDTPLPCDVTVGHVIIRKGVALRTLVARMQVLYDMAQTAQGKADEFSILSDNRLMEIPKQEHEKPFGYFFEKRQFTHEGEKVDTRFVRNNPCDGKLEGYTATALYEYQKKSDPVAGPSGDFLTDFQDGQWWLSELDSTVANGTPDQKRAVAVVRNLLATIAAQPKQEQGGIEIELALHQLIDKICPELDTGNILEDAKTASQKIDSLAKQGQGEPVVWRELCRRLYVELFYCDQQMTSTKDEDGEPMWQTGSTVRDVLNEAKQALETTPRGCNDKG